LQHQDGHSLILSSTIPTLATYDPAFTYEMAIIIADGMRRMYVEGEDLFYYLSLYNENYYMPPMPRGVEEGILKGLYRFKAGPEKRKHKAHIFGSGPIIREALRAQQILAEKFDVSADVWSATSYKLLRNEALRCKRWNMLHPAEPAKIPYVTQTLKDAQGPFIAVSDYMKVLPESLAKWVPGQLVSLGTDGFGRSESRVALRDFFEVDAKHIVLATLGALAREKKIATDVVQRAIKELGINPEKANPAIS